MKSVAGMLKEVILEYLNGNILKQKKYAYKTIGMKYNYYSNAWVHGQIHKIPKENIYAWGGYLTL